MKHTHYFSFSIETWKHFITKGIKTICFLSVIVFSYNLSAQETTWNGSQNSDWGNSSNWSNGVPSADDWAIIESSNNDPIIENDGIVNLSHLRIEEEATLTIAKNEIVNIKRFDDYQPFLVALTENIGIRSTATLINYGQINIEGNPSHTTEYGIFNNGGTVINEPFAGPISVGEVTGEIKVTGESALRFPIHNIGTFTNEGTITVEGHLGIGIRVVEQGTFDNQSGSSIELMGANTGIQIDEDAMFTNDGTITIEDALISGIRLTDDATFTNDNSISVSPGDYGILLRSESGNPIFTNNGTITTEDQRLDGVRLEYQGEFINNNSITARRGDRGIRMINDATFTNSGTITIEDQRLDGLRLEHQGEFINNNSITARRGGDTGIRITNDAAFTNSGTVTVEDPGIHGIRIIEQGSFVNNQLIEISGGSSGIRIFDNSSFTNKGTLNIDRAIDFGLSLEGTEFINDVDAKININQRFEETTGIGIAIFNSLMFENKGGIIRIGGIKRIEAGDISRFIQTSNNTSFTNSQGGLIYLDAIPTNISDAIGLFHTSSFFNDRCSGIINSSIYRFIYSIDVGADPSFGNNGWIISYSDADSRITNNNIGTIINFGDGAFNIANGTDIPANNDPMVTQDAFCNGTENIQFSSYDGTPNLDFCFDLVFKRLDNGETNVTGIFNDLQPGQSYDFEISWNGEAVDTFTYDVSSVVDNTPPSLNCTSESFTFDLEDDPSPTLTLDDLTTADPVDVDCTVATFEIQGYGASRTFSCDDAGTNTLTVVAIDQAGNTNTCTVDVEITGVYPEVTGMLDLDVYLDENGTATLSDNDLFFLSNLSTPCFTQAESEANYSVPAAYQNLDCDDIGTTSFLLDSADPNFPDEPQTITVIDSTPVRASVADVIVVLDESGVGTLDESDLVFTVSDNCYTDAEIEAAYSIPSEFNTFDCTQIGTFFITLDKNNNDFPEVILQVTVESTDLSFDPIVTDFCANSSFDLTSLEDQITTANGTFTYTQSIERLYIPNGNDNNVSVIDLASNSVIATIAVGTRPQGVGVRPDGKKVYILNESSDDVSVIDVESNTVESTIDVGNFPLGTAFNADGSRLYVTNVLDDNISVINTATNTVVNTITTGMVPWGIALSPDDSKIYVANQGDNNVSVINANTGATITTIAVQNNPYDVTLSADGTKMYVGNANGFDISNNTKGAISIIDISTDAVVETLFTESNYKDAYDFAVHPTGNLYTSHLRAFEGAINRLEPNNGNAITYYNIEDGVLNDIQGISLNEDGSILYLVDEIQDKVIFFNTLTNTEGMSIAVGDVRWCVGEFYVKTTFDIADPTNYVPSENEVIDVAFDGGAECESTTTITFTKGDGCLLFVNADADLGGDGTSWTTAFKYLQDAIALANTDDAFSEIWVAQGVYYPDEDEAGNVVDNDESASFQLFNEIDIFGGFNGTETMVEQRDIRTYTTILSGDIQQNDTNTDNNNIAEQTNDIQGDNSDHVVTGSSTNNTAILDGFTITAGQADGVGISNTATGAGMLNIAGSPTLRNLSFIGNEANVIGGGMYNNTFSDPTLTNVSFIGNSSNNDGGAIANRQQSDPILTNVVFSRNTAAGDGGALHNATGTSPTLINVSFSQNTAMGDGGGIYNINSDPMITNSIFYGNTADGSGNSIGRSFLGSAPIISYSYFDDTSLPAGSIDDGNNLLGQVDPFVDAASDDLQLVAFSMAIDAGDNSQNSTTEDVENNARNYDDANVTDTGAGTAPIIDMGAFERQTDSEDNCLSDPITLSDSETSTTDYITQAEITSTQIIESGSMVLYQAGTTITLGVGFHAKNSSTFTAKIEDCAAQNSTDEVVENRTEETSWADSNETIQELQLEVFPNPFSSSTNIQFHLAKASDVTLSITNMNGQVVHQQQYLDAPSGWQQHQFEASHLPDGMYFLYIRSAEQQTIKQLIIQK